MLPTVHKRFLGAVFAALLALLAAAPAQAAAGPRIKTAYPVDSDHDGHVDGVSLRWSKAIRGGYDAKAPFAISVKGYRVTKVGGALGKVQHLDVRERPGCDTGGSVRLSFRSGRKGTVPVREAGGEHTARSHKLDMRRFQVPVPRITCAVTLDADADSRVDGVRVTYSREVRSDAQTRGRFLFSVAGYKIKTVKAARGRFLEINVAERGAPDSGAKPAIGYSRPASQSERRFSVRAGKRSDAFAGTYRSTRDGVSPRLIAAATGDADHDGLLDAMTLQFSEPVRAGTPAALAVLGMKVLAATPAPGSRLTLSLAENTARGDALPGTSIAGRGVRDDAGNGAVKGAVSPVDRAPPVMIGAITVDATGAQGRIDGITLGFSEPVVYAAASGGPYPITVGGRTITSIDAARGREVRVQVAEGPAPDGGTRPQVAYVAGTGREVTDPVGNTAVNGFATAADGVAQISLPPTTDGDGDGDGGGGGGGPAVDDVAPVLLSATTRDADGDGRIDRVALGFSENVEHAAEASPASFSVTGYTVTSATAANGPEVSVVLDEGPAADTAAQPTVNYTPDGQEDIRDPAGNFAPAATIAAATDGARPKLLFAETQDADDDGRLDGLATTWSEPLVHADDSAAPFPISTSGFAVTRVHAASGSTLAVDLQEPSAHDTGSAPSISYGGTIDPIRDASGLEPALQTYAGLTIDTLPPRLAATSTADTDFDGRIDAVELTWSETVTGATSAAPFTVSGRTVAANVSLIGAVTRIPFTEIGSGYDGDATAVASYDASTGNLHDIAEGPGDTTAAAPGVNAEPAADKAAPIIVAAKTADLSTPGGGNTPNGTIDAMLVTFSEPISHAADLAAPFSLNVAGRSELEVEGDIGPSDTTLYVRVNEGATPDGGETPNVSVVAAGFAADRIKDRAVDPNEAHVMTFTNATDEVRPVLVSAQLGEHGSSGGCTKDAVSGIDGQVDCVLTTWSEGVEHAADIAAPPYSLLSSGWSIDAGGIGQLGPSTTLEIPLAVVAGANRDRAGTTVSYDGSEETPVVDDSAAANEALDGTKNADAACRDNGQEPNDVREVANPLLNSESPAFERKCAFDHDWFRVTSGTGGDLDLSTRPVPGVDIQVELVDATGAVVTPSDSEVGGAGQVDRLTFTGLGNSVVYWAHVTADDAVTPQEGPYCVVFSNDPTKPASCGPLAGQVVFTEVGFGADKFVEIKNDVEVPVELKDADATLEIGDSPPRDCDLLMPTGNAEGIIDPDEHVVVTDSPGATAFGCDEISSLDPGGERLELKANGAIDLVMLEGVIASPVASEHSLQFVERTDDLDHFANDATATRWCRTFAAHSKGAAGDGCDEYRINEVLWRPTSSSATSDGRAFVELTGNIPALADSQLLGGWVLRGVNGLTGDGGDDLVLAADASPRANGTYVIADGVSGVTQVAPADQIWDELDLNAPTWPDGTGSFAPRGLQLLLPTAGSSSPCTGSADAFGWTTTGLPFTSPQDDLRGCPGVEGQAYTNSTVGSSAARDNLSSAGDTTYNENYDTVPGNNRADFCLQAVPNPAQLNIRPSC